MSLVFKDGANMFDDWGLGACPIIPTNLTKHANAGIAAEVRKHTPMGEFEQMHRSHPQGGLLQFSSGQIAWDLPTKRDLNPGTNADIELIRVQLKRLRDATPRLKNTGVTSILLPKVGAGLGNLQWRFVWKQIEPITLEIGREILVVVYARRETDA